MVSVTLLGSAQDGGVPQVGCDCCIDLEPRYPVSIGLVDSEGNHHLHRRSHHDHHAAVSWPKALFHFNLSTLENIYKSTS